MKKEGLSKKFKLIDFSLIYAFYVLEKEKIFKIFY